MKKCELERLAFGKRKQVAERTGEKLVSFIDDKTDGLLGATIELKKKYGLWIVDNIGEEEVDVVRIKRVWSVGASSE